MATQTRRTTRRSARFFRATVKAYMVTACCGLVLLSAVSSYASVSANGLTVNGLTVNGMPVNGLTVNGMPLNGLTVNGMPLNGLTNGLTANVTTLHREPLPAVPQESFPFHSLSQRALGKPQP